MHGYYDVQDYGAVPGGNGTTGTDNLAAFNACLADAKQVSNNACQKIIINGQYYLKDTWHIRQTVDIVGSGNGEAVSGLGASRSGPGAWLVFPTGCDGIHFHSQGEVTGGADYSSVRGVSVYCQAQRAGVPPECPPAGGSTGSGIFINCPVYLYQVSVNNFAEHGIWVDAGKNTGVHPGNAGGFRFDKCIVSQCGKNGIFIRGGDATVGLIVNCTSTINYGWGYRDETIGNTYVACHGEANRGFSGNGAQWCEYSADIRTKNSSTFIGCYAEGSFNELAESCLIIGNSLSLPQFQKHQDGSQGYSGSIGPGNAVSGMPLSFLNTAGPDQTLIEFGSQGNKGVDGVVLNFTTPGRASDYNSLRWNDVTGWWGLHNSSPNGRTSIQFPTTISAPRHIAPLFEHGIFYGKALTTGDSGASAALVSHTSADAPPAAGVWEVGDIIWNSAPRPGKSIGWVCTTAGNFTTSVPTFKGFGTIDA
jgi:hypothetical protein